MSTPETLADPCSCRTERTETTTVYCGAGGSTVRRKIVVVTVVDPKCPTHGGPRMRADLPNLPKFDPARDAR